MLAAMRANSRNVIIYVLFGILIAVFVINFGPGSNGCEAQIAPTNYAAKIGGETLSEQDYRFAYLALGGGQFSGQAARDRRIKEFVMDKLIERELFAQEAERLGFAVSQKEVEDMIADGRMLVMGVPRRIDAYVFKDGKFDYERFKQVAQNELGVTVMHFIEIEERELMADRVRQILKVGTKVSPEEVKGDYLAKGLQVNLQYVRYSPRRYEDAIEVTPAEVDAYVKSHGDELKKQYEERAFLYKKIDKQARLRHVFVEAAKDATPAEVAAAKKTIDQAAAKVKAGTSFGEVAKELSADEHTKLKGGLIGWRKKGFTGMPAALDTKIFDASTKKGALIGPERTDRGFELVQVEDFREGDVPLAAAEREIAEDDLSNDRAKAMAKTDADALMTKLKAGGKLEALVPAEPPADETQEQKRQLSRRLAEPPKLLETGLFSRRGDMVQDIGVSKDLAKRAFELKADEVAGPFEVAGGYVVVKLKEHKDPDLADFEKREPEIMHEYEREKWAEVLDGWARQRCTQVKDDGRIKVNTDVLTYDAETGKAEKSDYQPCSGARLF